MTYTPQEPNFSTIVVEKVTLPYRTEPYLKLYFTDPLLEGYEVTIIADSTVKNKLSGIDGERLLTIVARFPRCILAEVNTHRVFGRNSASSRARAVKATIHDVMTQPYVPLFTKNQKGMSGVFLSAEDYERAKVQWLRGRDAAVDAELRLLLGDMIDTEENVAHQYVELLDRYYEEVYNSETPDPLAISVHKQDANRIIEPFMWHEAIITSSFWDNFLELRCDLKGAQPGIVAMGLLVERALQLSKSEKTWLHLPFIAPEDKPETFTSFDDMRPVLLRSATECAQISYKDKSRAVKVTATTALGEKLLELMHLSPFEHIAFETDVYLANAEDSGLPTHAGVLSSNLHSDWVQLRKVLAS